MITNLLQITYQFSYFLILIQNYFRKLQIIIHIF